MPDNTIIKSDNIKDIARGQAVAETRLPVEGEFKLLSASATASVRPSELFAGEARYTGAVKFDIMIVREQKLECVSAVCEFSDKITSGLILSGMTPLLSAEVVNCEASADGGSIKAVAVVDTSLSVLRSGECECVLDPDDGIFLEKRTLEYGIVSCRQTETAYVSDSVSCPPADSVVCTSSRAVVTSAECGDGEIKVSGTVHTDAVFCGEQISSIHIVTPFAKTIQASGVAAGDVCCADCAVTEATAALVSDGGYTLELAVTLALDITAMRPQTSEIAVDAFCADSELDIKRDSLELCSIEQMTVLSETVDGQTEIAADKPPADSVACVTGVFASVTDARPDGGKITVDGLLGGDIIYYNGEGNVYDAVQFRLPFSLPLSVSTDGAGATIKACVTDINVKVRRGSLFDVKADIAFCITPKTCRTVEVVSGLSRGEAIERPSATVIVHIARPGETLWQAAKSLGCSPERVAMQNDIPSPYKGGERLINFCSK